MVQRLGLAGHKNASYALLAQLGLLVLHFVLESAGDLYLFGTVGDPGCSPDEATIECLGTAYLASSCILNGRIVAKQLHVYQGAELRGQVRSFTGAHKVSPHIAHLGDDTPTSAEANVVLEDIEAQFDSSNLPVPAFSR